MVHRPTGRPLPDFDFTVIKEECDWPSAHQVVVARGLNFLEELTV
ncbi:hypothetical protein [Rubritalea tangerina]